MTAQKRTTAKGGEQSNKNHPTLLKQERHDNNNNNNNNDNDDDYGTERKSLLPRAATADVWNRLQLFLSWLSVLVFLGLALGTPRRDSSSSSAMTTSTTSTTREPHFVITKGPNQTVHVNGFAIPKETASAFGTYPNPLNITDEERKTFHPVVEFPKVWMDVEDVHYNNDNKNEDETSLTNPYWNKRRRVASYKVMDLTVAGAQLATEQERDEARRRHRRGRPTADAMTSKQQQQQQQHEYKVGRYDENRLNLYASEHYEDLSVRIDGYSGARTLHMGIDLDGPLGTKVHAFADGIIHSVGYNPELGDYGNVIVMEHNLGGTSEAGEAPRKLWALYGHLDDRSIVGKTNGTFVKKGKVIGRMGDIHENGGWLFPHVHFQLSMYPPETHDMPGTVSIDDRPKALFHYPDPRLVLGPLY